jgi:hypothetical protein
VDPAEHVLIEAMTTGRRLLSLAAMGGFYRSLSKKRSKYFLVVHDALAVFDGFAVTRNYSIEVTMMEIVGIQGMSEEGI